MEAMSGCFKRRKQMRIIRVFIYLAAVLLFTAAAAKLISSLGNAGFLEKDDPLFHVTYRNLFWIVGTLELGISLSCVLLKRVLLRLGLIAWISTSFLVYRASMSWVGYKRPCPCLGSLTSSLHIPAQAADVAMKVILVYLLLGSYIALFWILQHRKRMSVPEVI